METNSKHWMPQSVQLEQKNFGLENSITADGYFRKEIM